MAAQPTFFWVPFEAAFSVVESGFPLRSQTAGSSQRTLASRHSIWEPERAPELEPGLARSQPTWRGKVRNPQVIQRVAKPLPSSPLLQK